MLGSATQKDVMFGVRISSTPSYTSPDLRGRKKKETESNRVRPRFLPQRLGEIQRGLNPRRFVPRHLFAIPLSLVLIAFIATPFIASWLGFGFVDDAYISMRYAKNWAEGIGPFFNADERVEGYTNFLWTFLLHTAARVGVDPPTTAFYLSVLCIGLTLPVTYLLALQLSLSRLSAVFATILLVTDAGWWAWSLSGLETPLLALLFSLIFLVWLIPCRSITEWIGLSLLVTAAALTRPEGILAFLYIGVLQLFRRDKNKAANLCLFVGVFVTVYLTFLLWRRWTYGLWLPNSFYAKHGFGGLELIFRGLVYVWEVFLAHPLWAAALLGAAIGGLKERRYRYTFGFAVAYLLIVVLGGGDHFTLGRFCVPLVPILSVLTADALRRACGEITVLRAMSHSQISRKSISAFALLAAIVFGMMNASLTFTYDNGGQFHRSEVEWAKAWGNVGRVWRERVEPDTLIAVTTAGALPYVSELPTIDILGINDHHISQRDVPVGGGVAGHEKGDASYVMQRRPQLLQIAPMLLFQRKPYSEAKLEELFAYPAQWELAAHPSFQSEYEYTTIHTQYGYLSYHRYRGNVE